MIRKSITKIAKEYRMDLSYTQLQCLENTENAYPSGNMQKWDCLRVFRSHLILFTNGNEDKTANIVNEWNLRN